MKNAYEVLRQKEVELARVRHEIASLRIAAPLLSAEFPDENPEPTDETDVEDKRNEVPTESEATGTDGFPTFAAVSRPRIWNVLKRGKQE
jgi:hypothetical protein